MSLEATARPRPKGYYFITPVWGESYVRLFLDTAIPAQLAPGNLPVFHDSSDSCYVIYTTEKDAETIRNAPIYQTLSAIIQVRIELIELGKISPHALMSFCHKEGITLAEKADAAVLFLNPDLVFADGSFRTMRRLAEAGTDVLLVPGIRTLKQGVVSALQPQYQQGEALVVPPRALMRAALDNLHPLADSSWWEEVNCDLIPANLYWRVGNEGIVARCFHLHPLMVYSQQKGAKFFGTVDDDFVAAACPDSSHDHVVTDSDELLTIELSNPGHMFQTGFEKESIDDAVVWSEQFASHRHRRFFQHTISMHTGKTDRADWDSATDKAHAVADAINTRHALPMWNLIKTRSPALRRRIIRWAQDKELLRINPTLRGDAGQGIWQRPLIYISHLVAYCIGAYFQIMHRLAAIYRQIKLFIYGHPWDLTLWSWSWRHVKEVRHAFQTFLPLCQGDILFISNNPMQSIAAHMLPKDYTLGMFIVDSASGLRVLDQKTAGVLASASYDTVIVERAFPQIRQCERAVQELHRVLAPQGHLLVLMNRVPLSADRQDYEICATQNATKTLLCPPFKVLTQKPIGNFALGTLLHIIHWCKIQRTKVRVPFILMAIFGLIVLPISLVLALIVHAITWIFSLADTSGKGYISSITLAKKQ